MIKLDQIKKRWWSELGVLIHSYGKCVWHLLNYMKNSVLAQLNLQAWYIAKAWELKNQENITRGPDIVANMLCLHRSPVQELDIFSLCNKLLQLTRTIANTHNSALQIAIQQCSATSCTGNVEHITSLLKVPVPSLSQIFTVESCEAVAILINRSNRRNLKHSNAIFEYYIITSVYFVNSCMIDWLCRCMTSC